MKYGTSFPTQEQLRSKELLPVAAPAVAQEVAPVVQQNNGESSDAVIDFLLASV
jgi:hypothetical protein